MTSCKSAISLVTNLWKEYGEIASQLGCTTAGIAVAIGTANPEIAPITMMKCLETKDKIEEAIKKANAAYEAVVGKTSSLTIGPRLLRLNTWEKGNIFGTFERLYCTSVPMVQDEVSITIKELDGKGKVGIAICTIDEKGTHNQLAEYTLNENKQEKGDDSQEIKRTFKNVQGKWFVVHLDGKSVTKTFKYQLFLDA
jgi:hypothetical protein